jgi:hypothetical protein
LVFHLPSNRQTLQEVIFSRYLKQTKSKKYREFEKVFGCAFESDDAYEKIYSKHFKTHYAGKPTKRFIKLTNKLRAVNEISEREILAD